ncbi:hypothetical protein HMSSN036_33840 [Paenibacillus macerans]|nr:hypothetical protein HMSSN036_33840 [Paenibacillus macerans]
MPQYPVGHVERLEALRGALGRAKPGLLLCGAGYAGVGIPDCIRQGKEAAESMAAYLGGWTVMQMIQDRDYNVNPFIVIWEVTRACALKCLHCRAEAQYHPDPRQLSLEEGKKLIGDIAEMDKPLFVFTGGDPLMRPDLFELARYAIQDKGLPVSMTPSATPRVTFSAVRKAKEVGLSRWAFSLDGSTAEIHDHFRGSAGSYHMTMKGIGFYGSSISRSRSTRRSPATTWTTCRGSPKR